MKYLASLALFAAISAVGAEEKPWVALFNNDDLTGWMSEIRGAIKHFVNGKEVIRHSKPELGGDAHADALAKVAGSK